MAEKMSALSRRERQIMDLIYRQGRATAAEVHAGIPDPPSYSAVRATLRVLEEKGHLKHQQAGASYVYAPTLPREQAKRSALRHLLTTFFGGSATQAVAALLEVSRKDLSEEELKELARLV